MRRLMMMNYILGTRRWTGKAKFQHLLRLGRQPSSELDASVKPSGLGWAHSKW